MDDRVAHSVIQLPLDPVLQRIVDYTRWTFQTALRRLASEAIEGRARGPPPPVNTDEEQSLAARYDIRSIPTIAPGEAPKPYRQDRRSETRPRRHCV